MAFIGHYWTLSQFLRTMSDPGLPAGLGGFRRESVDPWGNPICLTGAIAHTESHELLVVLHGLGGSIESRYMARALSAALGQGLSCLLLNARGAGNSSASVAHAGLTEDLEIVLSADCLARYEKIYLLGYSMGGHITLSYACESPDPRVKSVIALCSPLDLEKSMRAFDRARLSVYRSHVLRGLLDQYQRYLTTGRAPISWEKARRIRRIFEWDDRIVAPSFGFSSAWDYYARASAAPKLESLRLPAMYLGARQDPMVPYASVEAALQHPSERLSVQWASPAGHLGFPASFTLGTERATSLEAACIRWLRASG